MILQAEASAPANIALIKYMGKVAGQNQKPCNASLSYTLENFRSFVQIRLHGEPSDRWSPLAGPGLAPFQLAASGREKFLRHFSLLKNAFQLTGHFHVQSANNFPSDCGLASSASSFAALTKCAYLMAERQHGKSLSQTPQQLANLSRQGSGSSIRSFAGPWVEWRGEEFLVPTDLPQAILHSVVIVEAAKKTVSSSEAHQRVLSSELFNGRPERAEHRLQLLKVALQTGDWKQAFAITWAEFWDMHALFETSQPPFGYMTENSFRVLQLVRKFWQSGDGPLATMDAGANVHLLFREEQSALRDQMQSELQTWSQVL